MKVRVTKLIKGYAYWSGEIVDISPALYEKHKDCFEVIQKEEKNDKNADRQPHNPQPTKGGKGTSKNTR